MIDDRADERPEDLLISLAREGDELAFAELVTRHRELAMRVARVAAPAADLEDAVQEAFVKAWFAHSPGSDLVRRSARGICKIVANEAKNRGRSAGRRQALALRSVPAASGGTPRDPQDVAVSREDAEALVRAMNRLKGADRLVIAYRWLFDLSEAEMAEALDVAVGTVKSRLSRAMTRLRTELAAEVNP